MNARMDNDSGANCPNRVVALSGGIGGAKLALGLKRVLGEGALTVVANTGDDFVHMGLHVSPDIDTLIYTLAGFNNPETGWGRAGETWSFMSAIEALGGENWFRLGDGDLAMHVMRTMRLAGGEKLSAFTAEVCDRLGIGASVMPMSDQPVRTQLRTDEGLLEFQDYFVRRQAEPVVHEVTYQGAENAVPPEGLVELLVRENLDAIVLCPSNPLISVEPILAVRGLKDAIIEAHAPVVAVSPIINGKAVKGPTAKMLDELGFGADATSVLERYAGFIDAFIADSHDVQKLEALGTDAMVVGEDIMMTTLADRERVARRVLDAAVQVRAGKSAARRLSGAA